MQPWRWILSDGLQAQAAAEQVVAYIHAPLRAVRRVVDARSSGGGAVLRSHAAGNPVRSQDPAASAAGRKGGELARRVWVGASTMPAVCCGDAAHPFLLAPAPATTRWHLQDAGHPVGQGHRGRQERRRQERCGGMLVFSGGRPAWRDCRGAIAVPCVPPLQTSQCVQPPCEHGAHTGATSPPPRTPPVPPALPGPPTPPCRRQGAWRRLCLLCGVSGLWQEHAAQPLPLPLTGEGRAPTGGPGAQAQGPGANGPDCLTATPLEREPLLLWSGAGASETRPGADSVVVAVMVAAAVQLGRRHAAGHAGRARRVALWVLEGSSRPKRGHCLCIARCPVHGGQGP